MKRRIVAAAGLAGAVVLAAFGLPGCSDNAGGNPPRESISVPRNKVEGGGEGASVPPADTKSKKAGMQHNIGGRSISL
jgi:hypothetical protein